MKDFVDFLKRKSTNPVVLDEEDGEKKKKKKKSKDKEEL